jgi:hypothetical protein
VAAAQQKFYTRKYKTKDKIFTFEGNEEGRIEVVKGELLNIRLQLQR